MLSIDDFINRIPSEFRILVIEGPDCAGKSYFINEIKKTEQGLSKQIQTLFPRFPDNREDVVIRNILFDSNVSNYRAASPFLFLADFVYWYESSIMSFNEKYPRMIWDRGIPSLSVYQKLPVSWIIDALTEKTQLPGFRNLLMDIDYIFLNPSNLDEHLERVSSKSSHLKNSYDPENIDDVVRNIENYQKVFSEIQELPHELFPRRSLTVIDV